jgi:hypothetical protein
MIRKIALSTLLSIQRLPHIYAYYCELMHRLAEAAIIE